MLLAFETSLILKSPSTVWNLISAHPPPRQVEYCGPTEHTKRDPHSVGGICTLSAEMGLSSVLSLSFTERRLCFPKIKYVAPIYIVYTFVFVQISIGFRKV